MVKPVKGFTSYRYSLPVLLGQHSSTKTVMDETFWGRITRASVAMIQFEWMRRLRKKSQRPWVDQRLVGDALLAQERREPVDSGEG